MRSFPIHSFKIGKHTIGFDQPLYFVADIAANHDGDLDRAYKLIELAKETGAKIITNDFNLNKVAQLHGVDVLNINELANVLRPVVLPGESMSVFVLKEGKEYNQGVAYLDDGTMVVVEGGRRYLNAYHDVMVTRVLQTAAGRIIFAQPKGG